jgi:type II restriction enzyme
MLEAKERLDRFINKQRVAMYKPIQVAEILYRVRQGELSIDDLDDVERYRNLSKRWRDVVTKQLIGQVSTSSQKFQDNLFEDNAIPPKFLKDLAYINNIFDGVIERYIYQKFWQKQKVVLNIWQYIEQTDIRNFDLREFLDRFRNEPGIRRSIDKAYEIVVYALFNALLCELRIQVRVEADPERQGLLKEFEDFTRLLLGIDTANPVRLMDARVFRTGVANAADRGLDMWANFGPAVQVKHLSLTEELAEDMTEDIRADEIVIVCKDAEEDTIKRILQQLGHRVRGIIKESQLVHWYERALRPELSENLGTTLIESLKREFQSEFPFSSTFEQFYREERKYDRISRPKQECPFWEPDPV